MNSYFYTGDFTETDYCVLLKMELDRTLSGEHNLPSWITTMDGMSGKIYRQFINNLMHSLPNARYLEIGSWAGSTCCAAMHGNAGVVTCIDNWSEFGGPKLAFMHNVGLAKNPLIDFTFIENDFREVDWNNIGKFNLYMFDGPHAEQDQYDGIALALPALDDEFILIVDDYNNGVKIRKGTERAFKDLSLKIRCCVEVRTTLDESYPAIDRQRSDWHNGYLFAVVSKKIK